MDPGRAKVRLLLANVENKYAMHNESEVLRLKKSEGLLMSKNEELSNQVGILRTALVVSDVPLPAGFDDSPQSAQPPSFNPEMPASVCLRKDSSKNQRLHVDWPAQTTWQPASIPARPAQAPEEAFISGFSHDLGGWNLGGKPLPTLPQDTSASLSNLNPAYENRRPDRASRTLDTVEVAVDFVLALEHPCMPHLPHPADPPSNEPTNHALLMSAPLMAQAPISPRPNAAWTANGSMIKELLNLSSAINLPGEITPVEAWHRLRQHSGFSRLDKWALEKIKEDLSTSARCCE
ncbi:MAG: hypothetical protein Q9186_004582 [Xanthomendoza sp. 1 TL-2023]